MLLPSSEVTSASAGNSRRERSRPKRNGNAGRMSEIAVDNDSNEDGPVDLHSEWSFFFVAQISTWAEALVN